VFKLTRIRNSVAISIGASFRSANIFDSLDDAQRKEIESQLAFARKIAESEVGVIIESPGHAKPIDIQNCAKLLASSEFPIMPLGPIPTDIAIGFDHVAAAIGASLMGIAGAAHILAAVTREEHTGEIPSIESTLEAVTTARIAAHIIDIHQLNAIESDFDIATKRAASHTCVSDKKTKGCSRCGTACPL
jgi:phosphomethylpyrimidine synthase